MLRYIVVVSALAATLYAAPPAVSNRAPGPDDIGYLPADGVTVDTNPPALAWLPEPGADAYTVQLARDASLRSGVITIAKWTCPHF
jgi:hypothetical protein